MWFSRLTQLAVAIGLSGTLLAGCAGYRMAGADDAPSAAGVRVAVPAFVNDTLEPLLSERVTSIVRSRLLSGGVKVTAGEGARMKGRVVNFSDEILSFDTAGHASHRRVVVTVEVSMEGDAAAVTPVWDGRTMVGTAEYRVTGNATGNRDAKDRAVEEAAFALAESLLLELAYTAAE
ncbi:MAG: LptE family protein [Leptospirillia bacterium]